MPHSSAWLRIKQLREVHLLGPKTRESVVSTLRIPEGGQPHSRFVGFTEARKGFTFVRHDPAFAMILVSDEGEGSVVIDGEWRPCPAGYAYVTAPRFPHAYHIGARAHWRLHWVIYGEDGLLPTLPPGQPPRLVPIDGTAFGHAVEGLCHEHMAKKENSVSGLWAALVDRIVLRILDPNEGDPRLDRLWTHVRDEIGAEWTVQRMARQIGMSEESLRRLCQLHHRESPMAFLTRLRMLAAADVLLYSKEKIASVGSRFGYADGFAFSTAFKRTLGESPREYRQSRLGAARIASVQR